MERYTKAPKVSACRCTDQRWIAAFAPNQKLETGTGNLEGPWNTQRRGHRTHYTFLQTNYPCDRMMNKKKLRAIPAVERVVQALGPLDLPRPAVVALVRRQLASLRGEGTIGKFDAIVQQIRSALDSLRRSRIQPVINGTGILIHTNLGRAPLGQSVVETLSRI